MKKIFLILSLLVMMLFIGSTYAAEQAKIGIAIPLSGVVGAYALDMKRGSEMAAEEFNEAGGIFGKPVKLFFRDSEMRGDVALRRFKEMVEQENLSVIAGNLSGGVSLVVNEWACKNNLLYMAFCHTSNTWYTEFCKSGFVSGLLSYQSGEAMAKYAFENLGKKWMFIGWDYRWGWDNLRGWLYQSEKHGAEFQGAIYIPVSTTDFSALIPQIMQKKPDVLAMAVAGGGLVSAIKQFAEVGLNKKMKIALCKAQLISNNELGRLYDENIYGVTTFYWTLQDYYENARPFVKKFKAKYGRVPTADVDAAYTGTRAILEAMKQTGTATDVSKLTSFLEGYAFQYNKGPEAFRACDHARTESLFIIRGKGEKAKEWDCADIVEEIPYWKTMRTCEDNAKGIPYAQIPLPGK